MKKLSNNRKLITVTAMSFLTLAALPVMGQNSTAATTTTLAATNEGPHKLAPLPYPYEALEPVIDVQTMRLHHTKHHNAYVTNLNKAVAGHKNLADKSALDLVKNLDDVPEEIRTAVRNNAGGHVNHTFFWNILTPGGAKAPEGDLAEAINKTFGSFEEFKTKFEEAGTKQFGSGWAWLVVEKDSKELKIVATPNQDSPLSQGHTPILGNDVWEHAYYLKYQNRRADYLKEWWKIVNWTKVSENYSQAK